MKAGLFTRIGGAMAAALMLGLAPAVAPADETRVPSGRYVNDPSHTMLEVSLQHLGLAPYAVDFADVAVDLALDVESPAASRVTVTVDPLSVVTTFRGDYAATHEGSPHKTWEEALAHQFMGVAAQPRIHFESTGFKPTGPLAGTVTGDLSIGGVTWPQSFDVTVTGQIPAHPMNEKPALGLVAEGVIRRSDYGITPHYDPYLGDEVTVRFAADLLAAPAEQ